jgi:hypothetical protein
LVEATDLRQPACTPSPEDPIHGGVARRNLTARKQGACTLQYTLELDEADLSKRGADASDNGPPVEE